MRDIVRFLGLTFIVTSYFAESYIIGFALTFAVFIGGSSLAYEKRRTKMPRMMDTVPIPNSTFIMDVGCRKCKSTKFKMRGRDAECDSCGEPCVRHQTHYESDTDTYYRANWRYDPIPEHATNI